MSNSPLLPNPLFVYIMDTYYRTQIYICVTASFLNRNPCFRKCDTCGSGVRNCSRLNSKMRRCRTMILFSIDLIRITSVFMRVIRKKIRFVINSLYRFKELCTYTYKRIIFTKLILQLQKSIFKAS